MKSIVLLALSMPLFGHAEVYKCVENGKTVYAQIPCSATAVRIRSSEDSAAEQQRLRDAAAQRQAAGKKKPKTSTSRTATAATTRSTFSREPAVRVFFHSQHQHMLTFENNTCLIVVSQPKPISGGIMSPLMQRILSEITHEAEQASLHAAQCKPLIDEAEALQKILVDHGCRHAQPDWLRYGGAIFYDHTHDDTMLRAIRSAGLTIRSETYEPDSQGHGTNVQILLDGYACRIWIHQRATSAAETRSFSPLRFTTTAPVEARAA